MPDIPIATTRTTPPGTRATAVSPRPSIAQINAKLWETCFTDLTPAQRKELAALTTPKESETP